MFVKLIKVIYVWDTYCIVVWLENNTLQYYCMYLSFKIETGLVTIGYFLTMKTY